MEGLDQVSDDSGCYDGPNLLAAPSRPMDRPHPEGSRLDRWTRIARTIEGEVIPRLLLAHRGIVPAPSQAPEAVSFDNATPERFARIVLTRQEDVALGFIHSLLESGLPLESIYLDLLAPTARWLGQQWTDDVISFTDVTIALTRLQRLMRTLSTLSQAQSVGEEEKAPLILLAAMPNDQHMFGVLMLEEFCRRDGLNVECLPACSRTDFLEAVKRRAPSVIGLSVSVDERLDDLRKLIRDIRGAVNDPDLVVMVGGRCFNEHPEYVSAVGADLTAVDGREAIRHIRSYLTSKLNIRTES